MLQNGLVLGNDHLATTSLITGDKTSMQPPWLNVSYNDLEGELWKEIPFLDGHYHISNLGRIKSLDRVLECKDGSNRFYKGRMLKGIVVRYKNHTIGDFIEEIKVGIWHYGKHYNIRVARMVYHLFIKAIDFKKDRNIVAHKDGNRFNNAATNLFLETVSTKQKKVTEAGRGIKLYEHQTKEGRAKAATARHKPITQFCLQGHPIKTYNSISAASTATGIASTSIINATKHITMVSAGGFLWQYGCVTQPIDTSFYHHFKKQSKQVKGIPLLQLDDNFEVLNSFISIRVATQYTGIHYSKIIKALHNSSIKAGDFYWKRGF